MCTVSQIYLVLNLRGLFAYQSRNVFDGYTLGTQLSSGNHRGCDAEKYVYTTYLKTHFKLDRVGPALS